jgi:hypothetical protein
MVVRSFPRVVQLDGAREVEVKLGVKRESGPYGKIEERAA